MPTIEETIHEALISRAYSRGREATESDDLGPRYLAREFARVATETCSPDQQRMLIGFLLTEHNYHEHEATSLTRQVNSAVEDFHHLETSLSGHTAEQLARPGGTATAKLGVILHIQSKDSNFSDFFDDRNATMAMLSKKGVSAKFMFGFDWHWRGETTDEWRSRTYCHFAKWPKQLRNAHDRFSRECLALGVKTTLQSSRGLTVNGLEFDLDFQEIHLRRIILYLPHPAAAFFTDRDTALTHSLKLDRGWEFMLWLVGKPYGLRTFVDELVHNRKTGFQKCSITTNLWNYRQIEQSESRFLAYSEFKEPFLVWAARYLGVDPAGLLRQGESLFEAVSSKLRAKLSRSRLGNEAKKRKDLEVQAIKAETKRLKLLRAKVRRLQKKQAKLLQHESGVPVAPEADADGSGPSDEHDHSLSVLVERDFANESAKYDTRDAICCGFPKALGDSILNGADQEASEALNNDLLGATDGKGLEALDNNLIDAIDDNIDGVGAVLEDEAPHEHPEVDSTASQRPISLVSIWDSYATIQGTEIASIADGIAVIPRKHRLKPLRMFVPLQPANAARSLGGPLRVFVTPTAVLLRIHDVQIFWIDIELLLMTFLGHEWSTQLGFELAALEEQTKGDDGATPTQTWKSIISKHRLLRGSQYKFSHGRCAVFDIDIRLNDFAGESIAVLGSLSEGPQHAHYAGTGCKKGDPGLRLGIWIEYTNCKGILTSRWIKVGGDGNVARLNTLVDTLEGRPKSWTEGQPRRYLKHWRG
ncbi:Hypothetical protein D9617_2g059670 [Elsinoe fawcettii]|nr:Hypothetical protein D9617_2g059670 [Elsinoe fawcettii]